MLITRRGMGSLQDFVRANFPEPWNPIWQPNWDQNPGMMGLSDFVLADFPEPHNPFWASQPRGIRGVGCGAGCGCDDCGMGAVAVPDWAATLPSPLNTMAGPLPVVYWGIGAVAAVFVLPMILGGGGRRRR